MIEATRPARIAIVGAGPAGIYAADALIRSGIEVDIDLIERMPAPFGLLRYGVAPDHPRIKAIVATLHTMLDRPQVRFLGNIEYGTDITLANLRHFYDAVIFATGAAADRALPIPGIELPGSYGAAEFVAWYDGNPDAPRAWPLDAEKVAVLGVGNVALDVARMLAKTAEELLPTEIPPNVHEGLKANRAREIHIFGRRGPAQAKFTPLELRELDHSPTIEVIVDPADLVYDETSAAARESVKQIEVICNTLEQWADRTPGGRPHRLFLHFLENPVEVLGDQQRGVTGLRTERTVLDGTGSAQSTGIFTEWPLQAIYRAVGYFSQPAAELPFDRARGVIPNESGRVLGDGNATGAGRYVPATYVTGWIKRGPVGLIGHTKGDATQTVACLLDDRSGFTPAAEPEPQAVPIWLEDKRIPFTTWKGWTLLDAYERALGQLQGRERVKVVAREEMVSTSAGRASGHSGGRHANIEP